MEALANKLGAADLDESVHTEDLSSGDDESEVTSSSETSVDEGSYREESDTEDSLNTADKYGVIPSDEDDSDDSDEDEAESKPAAGTKRKRANKWLAEVKYYQKSTELLIPQLPFERLVREIAQDYNPEMKFTQNAFEAIQTVAEDMLVELFECAQVEAIAHKNQTVMPKDFMRVRRNAKRFRWDV